METKIFTVRSMTFIALMAALICVCAPFVIPLGAVPLSLATFAVYLSGALLGAKRGMLAVIIYLLLGTVGVPVFAGFTAGLGQLLGLTGGFLIGYIPCALLTGIFAERTNKLWGCAVGMTLGTVSCYAVGSVWYMALSGADIISALMGCVAPFIPGDCIKIAAACAVVMPMRKRIDFNK